MPSWSKTSSPSCFSSSASWYWKPEQPPPLTATRSPASGCSCESRNSLTFLAAMSVRVTIWTPDSSYEDRRYPFYSNADGGATQRAYRGCHSWIDSIGRGLDRHGRPLPRRGGLRALRRAVAHRAASARLLDLRRRDRRADPRALDQDNDTREQGMTNEEIRNFLQQAIDENEVMLFMKGTPEPPACCFSMRASGALNQLGVPYAALDILPDPRIRQELSALSNWPTIPQLFVDGELGGGCGIVTEMYETGELAERLGVAQPDTEPTVPAAEAPQTAPLGIENRLN